MLTASTSSIISAAPTTPSSAISSLTASPYAVHAGHPLTVTAELSLPDVPETVTVHYLESGQNPQRISIDLHRDSATGRYQGVYTSPEIIDRSMGFIATEIGYTLINHQGERELRIPVTSGGGSFFLMRPKVSLASYAMPATGLIGEELPLSLTFQEPLTFSGETRIVFQATNSAEPVTFVTEPLAGDGAKWTTTARLPARAGTYDARYLRIGGEQLPIFAFKTAAIEVTPASVPTPHLASLNITTSPASSSRIAIAVDHPDSIHSAKLSLIGPYRDQLWAQLSRQEDGTYTLDTSTLDLRYTGNYYLNELQIATKAGEIITVIQAELYRKGATSFFHYREPASIAPHIPTSAGPSLTDLAVSRAQPGTYQITATAVDLAPDQPVILTFAGLRYSQSVLCEHDPEADTWQGTLALPDWARSGSYQLSRAALRDGTALAITHPASFTHSATSPDLTAPELRSARATFKEGVATVDLTFTEERSGIKMVRIFYLNTTTGQELALYARATGHNQWQASFTLGSSDLGEWALTAIHLEDRAGNTRMLGSANADPDFCPNAHFYVDKYSLDRIKPYVISAKVVTKEGNRHLIVAIRETGTGIDLENINISLSGVTLTTLYDRATGEIISAPLDVQLGGHSAIIQVADRAGNLLTAEEYVGVY